MFVEYNHADFGTNSGTFNSPVLGPVTLSAKSDVDLVLFGLLAATKGSLEKGEV